MRWLWSLAIASSWGSLCGRACMHILNNMYNCSFVQFSVVCIWSSCIIPVDSPSVSMHFVFLVKLCSFMYAMPLSDDVYVMFKSRHTSTIFVFCTSVDFKLCNNSEFDAFDYVECHCKPIKQIIELFWIYFNNKKLTEKADFAINLKSTAEQECISWQISRHLTDNNSSYNNIHVFYSPKESSFKHLCEFFISKYAHWQEPPHLW